MSLLLDALKNAEQAKARSELDPANESAENFLEFETPGKEAPEPVQKRNREVIDPIELLNNASLELIEVGTSSEEMAGASSSGGHSVSEPSCEKSGDVVGGKYAQTNIVAKPEVDTDINPGENIQQPASKSEPESEPETQVQPAVRETSAAAGKKPNEPDPILSNTNEEPGSAAKISKREKTEKPLLNPAESSMLKAQQIVDAPRPLVGRWNPWLVYPGIVCFCGTGLLLFYSSTQIETDPAFESPPISTQASLSQPLDAAPAATPAGAGNKAALSVTQSPIRVKPASLTGNPGTSTKNHIPATSTAPVSIDRRAEKPVAGFGSADPGRSSGATMLLVDEPHIVIRRSRIPESVQNGLALGYRNLKESNFEMAKAYYLNVLEASPGNRDALLGLGEIAKLTGSNATAKRYFEQALQADPENLYAKSALSQLAQQHSPLESESELKFLISENPDTANLHFILANLYAGQSRWTEAQSAYSIAFKLDSSQPDYAFNLAISLDQQGDSLAAVHFYQLALQLAGKSTAQFDKHLVMQRIDRILRPQRTRDS